MKGIREAFGIEPVSFREGLWRKHLIETRVLTTS